MLISKIKNELSCLLYVEQEYSNNIVHPHLQNVRCYNLQNEDISNFSFYILNINIIDDTSDCLNFEQNKLNFVG